MSNPFFSIIIPTYNRAHIIQRAIDSVLNQSFQHFELIIVDDGGIDNTESVIKNIADDRIRYHKQNNSGVSAARNCGARLAAGKFLVFLDSDDWLSEQYWEKCHRVLTNGNYKLLLGTSNFYNQSGEVIQTVLPSESGNYFAHGLTGSFVISSSLYSGVGGYDENLTYSENSDLFLRLFDGKALSKKEIVVVPDVSVCIPMDDSQIRMARHASKRYENVTYFLNKHKHYFDVSLNDYVNFKKIQAVAALQSGKAKEAQRSLYELIKRKPFSPKIIFLYFFAMLMPEIAIKYYS